MSKLFSVNWNSIKDLLIKYIAVLGVLFLLIAIIYFSFSQELGTILFIGLLILFNLVIIPTLLLKLYVNIKDNQNQVYSQMEALVHLNRFIEPKYPLPKTRNWAASPDLIAVIFKYTILTKPKTILELGSGVSTLYIGYLIKQNQLASKLISIDHSEQFSAQTFRELKAHELDDLVQIHYTPLDTMKGGYSWYNISKLQLDEVDLLIVDGPPTHDWSSRYGAFTELESYLSDNCVIIVDDYYRSSEKQMVQKWLEDKRLRILEQVDNEKGVMVLQFNK